VRIVVFVFCFLRLIFASCSRIEKSLPGCNHIRQTVSAESACSNTDIGGIRIFSYVHPLQVTASVCRRLRFADTRAGAPCERLQITSAWLESAHRVAYTMPRR